MSVQQEQEVKQQQVRPQRYHDRDDRCRWSSFSATMVCAAVCPIEPRESDQ